MNAPATEPLVLSARDGQVLTLTLNRPNARNALSEGLMGALQTALDSAAADTSIRVVVLAANGPAFSSGHDLKEMTAHRKEADGGKAAFAAVFAQCSKLMQTIVRHPKPVIAQVQGIATAAGCQLVASCDLAVASADAKFATPGVNIGLFCSTPMVALARNVSRKHAMEMLLTGDMISASQAYHMGLVNRVVTHDTLEAETVALAQKIASKPHSTVRIGKEAFYCQLEMGLSEAYDYASRVMTENMLEAEACEGIGAFVEKREPKWSEMTSHDLSNKSNNEIDSWISNHEKQKQTDSNLYRDLLEERARRNSHGLSVEKTVAHLRECAGQKRFTTYGKLAKINGLEWNVARRPMPKHLDRVLEICHARRWPLLTALCVKQNEVETGNLSGDALKGFISCVRRLGYQVVDDKKFLRECQKACFEWAEGS